MSQASFKVSEGKLPAGLAAALDPRLRDALENPIRREVLRTLQDGDRALSATEIAGALGSFATSEIAYHLRVLDRAGGAAVLDNGLARPGDLRRYASCIADNVQALAALRATQQWDRNHRRTGDRRSSTHLTMFRVPRPVRSIRLGKREGEDRDG